ncbi:unnamed protein product, partial [Rotaria sp. Silwood1]
YLYKPIHELIQQKIIYSSCFKTPKSDYIPIFGHMFSLAGQISKRGKKWKTRRRIITPSFHDSNLLANYIDIFNEQLDIGLKCFQTLADQQVETDLYPLISAWTLDVICETAMGKTVRAQTEESEYIKAVVRITELIALRTRSPWLWPRTIFKLTAQGREHDRLLKIIHKFTRQVRISMNGATYFALYVYHMS